MTQVTMMGNPIEVSGNFPKKGEKVTALTLTNKELADVTLDAYAGKRKVLNISRVLIQVYVQLLFVNSINRQLI